MLFFVKNRLFMEKMEEFIQKTAAGEVVSPADYGTIYCSSADPGVGYVIFDVENREKLDSILAQLEPYSEVYEVAYVLTLEEFQQSMM